MHFDINPTSHVEIVKQNHKLEYLFVYVKHDYFHFKLCIVQYIHKNTFVKKKTPGNYNTYLGYKILQAQEILGKYLLVSLSIFNSKFVFWLNLECLQQYQNVAAADLLLIIGQPRKDSC